MKNPELEESLLAYVFSSPGHLLEARDSLGDGSFECYDFLWKIVDKYFRKYKVLPTPQVMDTLLKASEHSASLSAYHKIKNIAPDSQGFRFFLDKMVDYATGNRLLRSVEACVDDVQSQGGLSALAKLKQKMFADRTEGKDVREMNIVTEAVARYDSYLDRKAHPEKLKGVPCGLEVIDQATGGFRPGELVLVVGGVGRGKSTLLLNMAYAAWKRNKRVLFMSLEMPMEQVTRRFDVRHAGVDHERFKFGQLTAQEEQLYLQSLHELQQKGGTFKVVDMPRACTALHIESKLATIEQNFDLVVVDYQGIMKAIKKSDSDWQEQGYITSELRQIGRAYNTTVITAMQLSKEGFEKEEADITNVARSWDVVSHCDIALILGEPVGTEMTIKLGKHRDGPPLKAKVYVDFARMLFGNMEVAKGTTWKDIGK